MNKITSEILSNAKIETIIGNFIEIKKQGNNYIALCPFHNDTNPSMYISPSKQIFKCFSCGIGGNVINFIKFYKKLDFFNSLKFLANELNLKFAELNNYNYKNNYSKTQLLNEKINNLALNIFKYNLSVYETKIKKNHGLLEFLSNRKITPEIINNFNLGFANDKNILDYFKKNEIDLDDCVNYGVIKITKHNEYKSVFLNQLIFPIYNLDNKLIGFCGRTIKETIMPKYLNIKNTPLFKKSDVLYNINFISKIHNYTNIIIVEGIMDIIAFFKSKILNCVASLGLNINDQQIKLLLTKTKEIVLGFDNDSAGINATLKNIKLFLKNDFEVYVLDYLKYKDADDFLKNKNEESLNTQYQSKKHFLQYLIDLYNSINNVQKKYILVNEIIDIIDAIPNKIKKELYLNKLSVKLNISKKNFLKNNKKIFYKKENYSNNINNSSTNNDKWDYLDNIEFNIFICLLKHYNQILLVKNWYLPQNSIINILYKNLINNFDSKKYKKIEIKYIPILLETLNDKQYNFIYNEVLTRYDKHIFEYDDYLFKLKNKYKEQLFLIQRKQMEKIIVNNKLSDTEETLLLSEIQKLKNNI